MTRYAEPSASRCATVHRGHVGRADPGQRVRLAQQRLPRRRVVGARHLDRDRETVGDPLGAKHRAEPTLAQRLEDAESGERRGWNDVRRGRIRRRRRCGRRRAVGRARGGPAGQAPSAGGAVGSSFYDFIVSGPAQLDGLGSDPGPQRPREDDVARPHPPRRSAGARCLKTNVLLHQRRHLDRGAPSKRPFAATIAV